MIDRDALAGLLSLDGRRALVTGGSGGIGAAVVRLLRAAGARVASVDLPGTTILPHRLELLAEDDTDRFDCDVGDPRAVTKLLDELERVFERLDAVVHCAGITRDAVLWKLEDADWEAVRRTNLDSAFYLLRGAIPLLRRAGGGSVVLMSSINGERGKFGQGNYAASKAGLIGLGRTAARELGRFGIRVNVLAPGLIDTPMTASLPAEIRRQAIEETVLGRAGAPEDVARAALFLVSPMAGHVTGQVLRIDGGQLMG